MPPREDLISSAVTFLQDPSVSSSPLQKRIEFLQSKNLTQEEIDLAIARSSDDSYQPVQQTPQNQTYAPAQRPVYGNASRYPAYGSPYPPYAEWQQPPPELPKRDWRDWFIMATVTGGAAYGLYILTKRYVAPLIAPPTPPQLEADKAAIDEEFNRAFALIDQLSTDTATLKVAEEARTERLDRALEEVETVVGELKAATKRREDDTRRLNDELRALKDGIPKALEGHKETSDKRLQELGSELRSLKALMGNRFGGSQGSAPSQAPSQPADSAPSETKPSTNGLPSYGSTASSAPAYQFPGQTQANSSASGASLPPARSGTSSPYPLGSLGNSGGKAAIPAWQMAASRKTPTPASSADGELGSSTPAEST